MIKENVLIARKIRKAAKILLSYSEDDVQKKIKDNLKVVTEGRKKFEALLPELHSEYARLEESIRVLKEAQKGIEAKLKAEFILEKLSLLNRMVLRKKLELTRNK